MDGSTRLVTIGPVTVREIVVAEEPPTHHAYSIRSVFPVRDHRADVWISAGGIRWESRFEPKIPGTGALLEAALRAGLNRLGTALVRAAERYSS